MAQRSCDGHSVGGPESVYPEFKDLMTKVVKDLRRIRLFRIFGHETLEGFMFDDRSPKSRMLLDRSEVNRAMHPIHERQELRLKVIIPVAVFLTQ